MRKALKISLTLMLLGSLTCCDGQEQQTLAPTTIDPEEDLGTGVDDERDIMDNCTGAAGPRPINEVFSPGRTKFASVDDVNGGFCGVEINTPGIWWWVNGTGQVIRTSSCHQNTNIKTKVSVFTGSCGNLRCVTGHASPDFECGILERGEGNNEWGTISTAVDFPTFAGQHYFILVQQESANTTGNVWVNFRHPQVPQNDHCVDAIGPVPRDMTPVAATTVDGSISDVPAGYCGGKQVPALYPGTWFQLMGTGGSVSVMACSEFNFDGFYFSVYNAADCDSLECVDGKYEIDIEDPERCSFGPEAVQRPMTKFTFNTKDRSRYYIYVHFARTAADKPTADFLFFADDGQGGNGGSSGAHLIQFEERTTLTDGKGKDGDGDDDDDDGDDDKSSGAWDSRPKISFLSMSLLVAGLLRSRSSLFT